jgi:hypothetical protein
MMYMPLGWLGHDLSVGGLQSCLSLCPARQQRVGGKDVLAAGPNRTEWPNFSGTQCDSYLSSLLVGIGRHLPLSYCHPGIRINTHWAQWLNLVILGTWESETRKMAVRGQPRQKVHKTPCKPIKLGMVTHACLSSQLCGKHK